MALLIPIFSSFLGFLNMNRWLLMCRTQPAMSLKAALLLSFVYLNSFTNQKVLFQ